MTIYSSKSTPSAYNDLYGTEDKGFKVTDGSERQLGKEAFLTLLLTQLQNQDPTNPMDNTEMTAQLAQFSQLEQLSNISSSIDSMTGYIQAQNQFQTLSMIGKDVLAENDQLSITDGNPDVEASVITTEACRMRIYIVDGSGAQVKMIDLGQVTAGEHKIEWDGTNNLGNKVEDGAYKFQVMATNAMGEEMKEGIYPQVSGKITSVSFDSSGSPIIHMGKASLALGQVIQILDGSSSSANKGDSGTSGG